MGELFAFISAAGFSLTNILVRQELRQRPGSPDNGLLITTIFNVVTLSVVVIVRYLAGDIPEWNQTGVFWFVLAGLLTTFLGRGLTLTSIRRLGSSRAAALKNTSPMVAVIAAILFLDEHLSLLAVAGVLLVFSGLLLLAWEAFEGRWARYRANHTRNMHRDHSPVMTVGVRMDDGTLGGTAVASVETGQLDQRMRDSAAILGVVLAVLAAVAFGSGQVVRKVGFDEMPDPFVGAAIGAWVALTAHLAVSTARGRAGVLLRDNFGAFRSYFWLAGLTSTVGLLSFFIAIEFAPVSHVSVIASAETVMTVILAAALFGTLESISRRTVVAAIAVFIGSIVIALR